MKDMKEQLQSYLLGEVEEDEESEEEERGNDKKIKTYIIESNLPTPEKLRGLPPSLTVSKSADESLYNVEVKTSRGSEYLFIDSSDSRFWLFHAALESGYLNSIMDEVVARNDSKLDYSWFASSFLERQCNIGGGSGFGLRYKNSFIGRNKDLDQKYLRTFSMLFWGGRPDEVLAGLKKNPDIASGLTLSRVGRVFRTDDGETREQISRKGKFTLFRGDSIDTHILAVDTIRNRYASLIRNLETNFRVRSSSTEWGYKVEGTYCLIQMSKEIEDMRHFVSVLLSCQQPFLLFGIPQAISGSLVKVSAVDLHTYDKFDMEIGRDFIRVFLRERSCGNVVARLMTNLQEFYDSQTKLMGVDNEQLL